MTKINGLFLGSILVSDFIDEDGHHAYTVEVEGELELAHILGLLELAKHDTLTSLVDEEIEFEEGDD